MPDSPQGLHPAETTIAEMLKAQGYTTGIFGKWHLGDHPNFMPLNQGFDEYFGIPYSNDMWPLHPQQGPIFDFDPLPLYHNDTVIDTLTDQSLLTTHITEQSIDFIVRNSEEPFFAYIAHPQPHVPLYVSDKFKGKSQRGLYGDVIMEIDWSVGQIVHALVEHDLLDNTLIIFTSDNGPWLNYGTHAGSAYPLREGKGTAWEGGQREPTVVHYPARIEGGRRLNTPMMNIDILPTIAEITSSELPEKTIDGKSLWSIWQGETDEAAHAAYYYYYKRNELHGVRYKDWKLYFPHSYRTLQGRSGKDDGTPVDYSQDTLKSIELYQLSNDVAESNDVAAQHPEVIDTITELADAMRRELGDQLTGITGQGIRAPGQLESDK
jgi:arylsulfatase